MNALVDKVHKQGMLHSDMHSITWPHHSTTSNCAEHILKVSIKRFLKRNLADVGMAQ